LLKIEVDASSTYKYGEGGSDEIEDVKQFMKVVEKYARE